MKSLVDYIIAESRGQSISKRKGNRPYDPNLDPLVLAKASRTDKAAFLKTKNLFKNLVDKINKIIEILNNQPRLTVMLNVSDWYFQLFKVDNDGLVVGDQMTNQGGSGEEDNYHIDDVDMYFDKFVEFSKENDTYYVQFFNAVRHTEKSFVTSFDFTDLADLDINNIGKYFMVVLTKGDTQYLKGHKELTDCIEYSLKNPKFQYKESLNRVATALCDASNIDAYIKNLDKITDKYF